MKRTLDEELENHQYVVITPVGCSMQPLMYGGKCSVIVEKPTNPLRPNDLPVYLRTDGAQVIHRIIRVGQDCYYIRGDNCLGLEVVPKEQVVGVVTKIYKNGRYISMDDPAYRCYVAIWNAIFPLRALFYRLKSKLSQLKSRWRAYETRKNDN